jgi:hypothetical protein
MRTIYPKTGTVVFRQDARRTVSIDVIIIENDLNLPDFDSLDTRGMRAKGTDMFGEFIANSSECPKSAYRPLKVANTCWNMKKISMSKKSVVLSCSA